MTDGCVTHYHPMFPQVTEWAGVETIDVMPVADHERIVADLRTALDAANRTLARYELCDRCGERYEPEGPVEADGGNLCGPCGERFGGES